MTLQDITARRKGVYPVRMHVKVQGATILRNVTNPVYAVASPLGEVAGYAAARFEHG